MGSQQCIYSVDVNRLAFVCAIEAFLGKQDLNLASLLPHKSIGAILDKLVELTMTIPPLSNCTFDISVLCHQERVCTIGFEAPLALELNVSTDWGVRARPIACILHRTLS
jgi:hypothetical protein